jgi:hypothetical protein
VRAKLHLAELSRTTCYVILDRHQIDPVLALSEMADRVLAAALAEHEPVGADGRARERFALDQLGLGTWLCAAR